MSIAALILAAASIGAAPIVERMAVKPENAPAEEALRAQLQERFPQVERWEIRPFDDAASIPESSAPESSERAQVVRVGARSAVRVGKRLRWYAVSGVQNVVSASRRINVGERVEASLGHIEERDVVALRCKPVVELEALNGMRARKPVHEGEVLCAESIEPRPVIARGDAVTVRYVGPRIQLQTKGIAQEDGDLGRMLTVKGPQSAEAFAARVSGAGEVTIHE
jgi:flagella basal body P-ring formation protein FlgA